MKLLRLSFCSLVFTSLVGCGCMETKSSATEASTCQILVRPGAIEQDINQKKQYLAELNVKLDDLDDELLTSQATLFSLSKEVDTLEIPEKELAALRAEINALEIQQEELSNEILSSKEKIKSIEMEIEASKQSSPELEQALEFEKKRVERIEKKLEIVKNGIKRTLALKQRS